MKHFNIKYCEIHDRFTLSNTTEKAAWANNFSKALKHMVVVNNKQYTHKHPTLDETYTITKTFCDKCVQEGRSY